MTFAQGFGLMILGIVITFAFFVVWVKAMESEDKNINRKDKNHE